MVSVKLAPVGTCRIHNPLSMGVGRYPLTPVYGRNYGYVHTSAEALQQLRYMHGLVDIPKSVRTLTFRPILAKGFFKKPHELADIYMVEISSRKRLTIDEYPLQLNYMTRHFSDFFSDRQRTRLYWSMASDDRIGERRAWLATDPAFMRLPKKDRDLLMAIVRHNLSDEEVERDIRDIAELVGKDKLVVVTHVNALKPDDTVIGSREGLIKAVKSIARKVGVPCYDPSPLMLELGQFQAMKNDGLDLTHFTDIFSERLCFDWFKAFVAPRMGGLDLPATSSSDAVRGEDEAVVVIETAWQSGQIVEAFKQVHEALRSYPDSHEHRGLLGRMQFSLGDYESAIASLERARGGHWQDEKSDALLMRAYFGNGKYEQARKMAVALIYDESETEEVVRICAICAAHLNDLDSSLADWKRLFLLADDKVEAADAVLGILRKQGDPASINAWANEVLQHIPSHEQSFVELWNDGVRKGDRSGLLALAQQSICLSADAAVELVKRAAVSGFATPAAVLAASHGVIDSQDREVIAWLSARIDEWLQEGMTALVEGRMLESADPIQACWQVRPREATLIRARRSVERRLRQAMREAFVAKNYASVVDLAKIATDTLLSFPQLESLLGRAHHALGDNEKALVHLKRAAQEPDASSAIRFQLARVALRCHRYVDAVDAYFEVVRDTGWDEPAHVEARRQLVALGSRLILLSRELFAQGKPDEARSLLDRLEMICSGHPSVERERRRMVLVLRAQVKALGASDEAKRLHLGETILRFSPRDVVGLKSVAVAAMRMQNFALALRCWEALLSRVDNPEQVELNIRKCALWIERSKGKEAARQVA